MGQIKAQMSQLLAQMGHIEVQMGQFEVQMDHDKSQTGLLEELANSRLKRADSTHK